MAYHPLLRKVVTLATRDCESENKNCISLFWTLPNNALVELSGIQNYHFNPKGWCMDEAGASCSDIEKVYG